MKFTKARILTNLLVCLVALASIGTGIQAYFSDTETSNGNTFRAGTLDLKLDDGDVNVVKWNLNCMQPGNQPMGQFKLSNVGCVNGYIDLESISITDAGGAYTDAEGAAGDPGNAGNLSSCLNIRLFIDKAPVTGWIGAEDYVFYNGLMKNLPSHFELNEPLNAGATIYIEGIIDWWTTSYDNKAQGDITTLDIGFELGQTTGQ